MRIVLYAIAAFVTMTTVACADPISGAIVAFAGLGGLGAVTSVATAIVDIGLAVGIRSVVRKLAAAGSPILNG